MACEFQSDCFRGRLAGEQCACGRGRRDLLWTIADHHVQLPGASSTGRSAHAGYHRPAERGRHLFNQRKETSRTWIALIDRADLHEPDALRVKDSRRHIVDQRADFGFFCCHNRPIRLIHALFCE